MFFVNYFFLISVQQQGFCFGFVEFESSSSMHSAIEVLAFLLLPPALHDGPIALNLVASTLASINFFFLAKVFIY